MNPNHRPGDFRPRSAATTLPVAVACAIGILLSACSSPRAPAPVVATPASPPRGVQLMPEPTAPVLKSTQAPAPMTAAAPPATPEPAAAAAAPPAAAPAPAPAPTAQAAPPAAPAASAPAAPPAPPPVLAYNDAVLAAANALFTNAKLPADAPPKLPLVIDPLIDGQTGVQSVQTRAMGQQVSDLVRDKYPRFDLQPFSTTTLARAPMLFIGTFTAVDKERKTTGERDQFRICLALVDLRTGQIVSKGLAFASPQGVDITPLPFFRDAPAWSPDAATDGYVRTCQGTKAGDSIKPEYWDRIVAAAMINDAITAYHEGRYDDALDLYRGIARTPAGDQLRVYNGLYLAAWKLGRKDEASQAFGRVVDFGLQQKRLGVKFLFRPGSTLFVGESEVAAPYPVWLKQIAARAGQQQSCLEVSGHTSRTGAEPLNERLSALRAQYVQQRLLVDMPSLAKRTATTGKGSRENIVGLGTDDARDALDRRVEFKVIDCAALNAT